MIEEDAPKAKKGIKVKDLAKDLGLTSRALIDRCRAEGMAVQNSITKLDRNAEKKVRGWFNSLPCQPGAAPNGPAGIPTMK